MLLSLSNWAECALLVSGDNYPIEFNISKNHISLIRLFICAKNVIEEKKSCSLGLGLIKKIGMPEKPFCYPFGIIGNLCNFTLLASPR